MNCELERQMDQYLRIYESLRSKGIGQLTTHGMDNAASPTLHSILHPKC